MHCYLEVESRTNTKCQSGLREWCAGVGLHGRWNGGVVSRYVEARCGVETYYGL